MKKSLLIITLSFTCSLFVYPQLLPPYEGETCATAVTLNTSTSTTCDPYQLNSVSWYPIGDNGMGGVSRPSCWGAEHNNIGWAKFTTTTAGSYTFDAICYTGGSQDVAMQVYSGSCGSLTPVIGGCEDAGSSSGCPATNFTVSLASNTTYYIAYSVPDGNLGEKNGICVVGGSTSTTAPANNDCSGAQSLTLDAPVTGTTVNATPDLALCSGSTENNVWYKFTPSVTQTYYLSVSAANCANDAGFQVSLYNAGETCSTITGGTGECISYANTATNDNFELAVTLTAGTTYYINIDGQAGTECTFTVEMSPTTTLNNDNILLDVLSKEESGIVQLIWTSTFESSDTYYVVERSLNSAKFKDIHIEYSKGVSYDATPYIMEDKEQFSGAVYYRIKKVSGAGAVVEYSKIRAVLGETNQDGLYAFPNPSSDVIYLQYNSLEKETHIIKVYDSFGKVVYSSELETNKGVNSLNLDVVNFVDGTYYLVLSTEDNTIFGKKVISVKK